MIFFQWWPTYDQGLLETIFNLASSVKRQETDVVAAELGSIPVKAEGATLELDSMQEVWSKVFLHLTYALGLEFTEEAIEDNLYDDLLKRAGRALAESMAYTRQLGAFNQFNDETQTLYAVGATNYPILSASHFLLNGSTWSNKPATNVPLSGPALEALLQQWTTAMVTQRGLKMQSRPATLMVGAGSEMLAHRLVNSNLRPQSNENDTNPVKDLRSLKVFMNPLLTDDGRWYLIAPKQDTSLTYFDRVKPGVPQRYDGGYAGDGGNVRVRARMRNSHGAAAAYGIAGSLAS